MFGLIVELRKFCSVFADFKLMVICCQNLCHAQRLAPCKSGLADKGPCHVEIKNDKANLFSPQVQHYRLMKMKETKRHVP
jgi:hypothetical protein